MKTFTSKEVQRRAKVSRIELVRWVEKKAIVPIEDVRGRGRRRLFSEHNICEAKLAGDLKGAGLDLEFIRHTLSVLRNLANSMGITGINPMSGEKTSKNAPNLKKKHVGFFER